MKITDFISYSLGDISPVKQKEIQYGLHILLSNLYKVPMIFLISYLLGIFQYTVAAFLSFIALRTFSSGAHAKTAVGCFFTTLSILYGAVYLGMYLPLSALHLRAIFLICIYLILRYAPADTPERPLVSKSLRRQLRLRALIVMSLAFVLCIRVFSAPIAHIIMLAMLIQCILLTPLSYKIMKKEYKNYEKIQNN